MLNVQRSSVSDRKNETANPIFRNQRELYELYAITTVPFNSANDTKTYSPEKVERLSAEIKVRAVELRRKL